MRANVKKSNEAMLEGDRDAVLGHLSHESSPDLEVLWLRAHAQEKDEDRLELLRELRDSDSSIYQRLASEILEREEDFERQLNEPPDYQFWKQPTWEARMQKLRQYRVWLFGALLLLGMIGFAVALTISQQNQAQQASIIIQATHAAVAYTNQRVAEYPAGSLEIIRVEAPTLRPVTFGETVDNQFVVATPAAGARFVAAQVRFTCKLSLCNEPPEALVILQLVNGQKVSYESSPQPFFTDSPDLPRISTGRIAEFWLVFEVPNTSAPDALLIYFSEQEQPQLVDWPVR